MVRICQNDIKQRRRLINYSLFTIHYSFNKFSEEIFMIVVLKQNFTEQEMHEAIKVMEAGGVPDMIPKDIDTTTPGTKGNTSPN